MIRVMIVDDEPLILEGLKNIIDWTALGFDIVETARTGLQALKKAEYSEFDVLITDIKMPELDGLALIEQLKEKQKDLKYIVLSGYQEFEFVRKGLQLGIENYLLKPIDEEELIDSLQCVREKIKNDRLEERSSLVLRDHCMWRWIIGKMKTEEFKQRIQFYPEAKWKLPIKMGLLKVDWEAEKDMTGIELQKIFEEQLDVIAVISPVGDLVIFWLSVNEVLWGSSVEALYTVLRRHIKKEHCIFVYSNLIEEVKDIRTVRRELDMTSELKMLLPKETYSMAAKIYFDSETQGQISNTIKYFIHQDLIENLANGEYEAVKEALTHTFGQCIKEKNLFIVKSILLELYFYIKNNFFISLNYETYVKDVHTILRLESLEQALVQIDHCISLVIMGNTDNQNIHSPVVQAVLKHIHQHYSEDMSLKTLGQIFYVNPIYLGQLFQKEVQCPFTKYLNNIRIENAKKLLLNSHEKAGHIGVKVGYADPAYFYKQFKKIEKVTPLEWRKKYKTVGKLVNIQKQRGDKRVQ